MKRLLLVRHGESEWNAARRLQGQADIGLSETGEAQAVSLAPTIAKLAPDRVITSDLRRARRTADLLGFPEAVKEPGLREVDVGAWTGREIETIIADEPDAYRAWRAGTFAPEGEKTGKASQRALLRRPRPLSRMRTDCSSCATAVLSALCCRRSWTCHPDGSSLLGRLV